MEDNKMIFLIFGKGKSGKSTLKKSIENDNPDLLVYEVPQITTQKFSDWYNGICKACHNKRIYGAVVLHAGHSPRLDLEQLAYYLFVKSHFSPSSSPNIGVFLTFSSYLPPESFFSELEEEFAANKIEKFGFNKALTYDSKQRLYKIDKPFLESPSVEIHCEQGIKHLLDTFKKVYEKLLGSQETNIALVKSPEYSKSNCCH